MKEILLTRTTYKKARVDIYQIVSPLKTNAIEVNITIPYRRLDDIHEIAGYVINSTITPKRKTKITTIQLGARLEKAKEVAREIIDKLEEEKNGES